MIALRKIKCRIWSVAFESGRRWIMEEHLQSLTSCVANDGIKPADRRYFHIPKVIQWDKIPLQKQMKHLIFVFEFHLMPETFAMSCVHLDVIRRSQLWDTKGGNTLGKNSTNSHFRPIFVFPPQPPEGSCATRAKRCEALRVLLTGAKTDQRKETLLKSADRFSTHYHFLFSSGVSFSAQRGSRHASTPLLLSRHMGLCTSPHRLAPSRRISVCSPPSPLAFFF